MDAASVKVVVLVVVVIPDCISRIVNTTTCRTGDVRIQVLLCNLLIGLPHDNDGDGGNLAADISDGSGKRSIPDINDDENSVDR